MSFRNIVFALLVIAVGLILFKRRTIAMYSYLKELFDRFEGFSPVPIWDVRQWSWGHGTRVPGSIDDPGKNPGGTITRAQALLDSYKFVNTMSAKYLKKIKVPLNDKQKAAVLSFGYNLGGGPLDKLIGRINEGDKESIEYGFKAYDKVRRADGTYVALKGLTARRLYEWNLFSGKV